MAFRRLYYMKIVRNTIYYLFSRVGNLLVFVVGGGGFHIKEMDLTDYLTYALLSLDNYCFLNL